ncbi:flagellar export chaperone FlgN [Lignipirellula cremea]|uniref:FlgN protein n=1 Tax=Lignipirellula cremea TaxID=2528010 RepID=A0A518DR46_9BACT|nr:flagellar export chaperone FlgN [Lignipirellula cremea]QDU94311.1 FlgN protein [Lignipirellula cremea]
MTVNEAMLAEQPLELQLSDLLNDLSEVQNELLSVLAEKRQCMAENNLAGMREIEARESQLGDRLEACHSRRSGLLENAKAKGLPGSGLGSLAKAMPDPAAQRLGASAAAASAKMRLLQHDCLTNWVLAQRSLLHISQILEIIATGGRVMPTYRRGSQGAAPIPSGGLVDREA